MMPDYRVINPYQELLAKALENHGVNVSIPLGYLRVFPIFRAIKSSGENISILHLHWLSPYLKGQNTLTKITYAVKFVIDILITKLAGVRLVWTIHNYLSHDSKFPNIERFTQQVLIKLVDKAIFHSSSALQDFTKIYKFDISKAEVIPHGHYRGVYSSKIDQTEARKFLELPLSGRIFLNLGVLRPYKGIESLLQVWQENGEFSKENTLLIAGKALDQEYLQKLTKLAASMNGVIIRPSFVEDSRIHLFYSAADVAVLPFEKILTSGSLILAMSYDKSIIAPRSGSIVETLGAANWLLYECQDNQGLVKSLKASNEIDLNQLSDLVRNECDKLSWDDIGIKTKQLYNKLLIVS
ncbi:glycosyltransferase [Synechococcus sp. PCC 7502]|uniref:glycosyltransferase n=1 Tax=Synechococcus sp. PCC 7502 TaxID=1173263 RepID=UPI001AEF8E1C|nr:glycosyltransferase [Synechococcus sp. PCC 7502]